MMGTSNPYTDEDWWTEMQTHMEERWDQVQDEEWFDEMTQFMKDQRYEYRYGSGYGYGYHGCH